MVDVENAVITVVEGAGLRLKLRNRGCTDKFRIHDAGSEISLTSLDDVMMSL